MADRQQERPNDEAVLDAIFNPLLPSGGEVPQGVVDETPENDESEEVRESRDLELQGVHKAEAGDMNSAIDFFNKAVLVSPERASCYNNRAQALRLRGDIIGALEDLNHAIELSNGRSKAACQAYTQRGLIRRLEGNNEDALEDFKKAACLGSTFARSQVVQMNPYAAMCNQMLSDVIGRLQAGEPDYES
ncbi:tetratricopeptide repeat protein 36 homolog [Asterias rubens]|uniref:tetratricopeptide repeat protein 36 homolog n=1 Tax=Asterias rubens TaxID=7604 RepID=UPI0014554E23|nr:tetratricopeptide repeat protein 36 homolog [Asterias rubens]